MKKIMLLFLFILVLPSLVYAQPTLTVKALTPANSCKLDKIIMKDFCYSTYLNCISGATLNINLFNFKYKTDIKSTIGDINNLKDISNLKIKITPFNLSCSIVNISAYKDPTISIDNIPCYDTQCDAKYQWWNASIKFKRNLTQMFNYGQPFLAGSSLLSFNDYLTEVWCDNQTAYLYYNNDTGNDVYCVDINQTSSLGTNLVNTTFPDTGNPWNPNAIMILHMNGTDGYDSSLYNHPKTSTTGTPITRIGKIGNGVYFSGSDYMQYGDINALDSLTEMTFSAWINISGTVNNAVASKYDTANQWMFYIENDIFNCYISTSISDFFVQSPFTLSYNTWYHVACVYDGSNLNLYINGSQVATTGATGTTKANNNNVNIGQLAGVYIFHGIIDELRLYNKGMNDTQILELYNSSNSDISFSILGDEFTSPPFLTLIFPSDDKVITTNNFTFVNVSSNKDLTECILDFNGTNSTMNNNSIRNFYYNETLLPNGNYSYTVFCTDTESNDGLVSSWVYINYTAPIIIIPDSIISNFTYNCEICTELPVFKQYCSGSYLITERYRNVTANNETTTISQIDSAYCKNGCSDSTIMNFGNPGCIESNFIIMIFIILAILLFLSLIVKLKKARI